MIVGLNFSRNELIHVRFTSELKNFAAYCVFLQTLALYVTGPVKTGLIYM